MDGFQGRSLDPSSQKSEYITIMLDEEDPKIYGLDTIRTGDTVYITEGPFRQHVHSQCVLLCVEVTFISLMGLMTIAAMSMIMNPETHKSSIESVEQSVMATP